MEFDAATLRPTYRLLIGRIGQSCAIDIARRLALSPNLIRRAEGYLAESQSGQAPELREALEIRREAEAARAAALAAQTAAEKLAAEWRLKTETLQPEAAVSAELAKARETLQPGDQVRVARLGKSGVVKRVDVRKRQAAVSVGAVEWQLSLDELVPVTTP
jgi:DNA mismatch repair protein MutS2